MNKNPAYRSTANRRDRSRAGVIAHLVALALDVPVEVITDMGRRGSPKTSEPRRVAIYVARKALGWNEYHLSACFKVSKPTALLAIKMIGQSCEADPVLAERVNRLIGLAAHLDQGAA